MAKKPDGRHWYQIHKAKAGEAQVERSSSVKIARERVKESEQHVQGLEGTVSNSIGSSLRRFILGRNPQEEALHKASIQLEESRRAAELAEREARRAGEKSYGADWASRNPDKAKRR